MYNSKSSEELAELMHRQSLVKTAEDAIHSEKLVAAVENLYVAAELFDDIGLTKESDFITKFIEKTGREELEYGYQDPPIPKEFLDTKGVKILAQNEWQMSLNKWLKMMGWKEGENINDLFEQELGRGYFTLNIDDRTEDIDTKYYIVLSELGYDILSRSARRN